jgi:hypothetical protein
MYLKRTENVPNQCAAGGPLEHARHKGAKSLEKRVVSAYET